MDQPHLISFKKIGQLEQGYISVFEFEKFLSFPVKRLFWTYHTPESVIRGKHAHYENIQVLIAAAGIINVTTETVEGHTVKFTLDNPNVGLYIPPLTWTILQYSHNAIQMALCSELYLEEDYIREYDQFQLLIKKKVE
ncbi:MAG: FdtA/QdtA family cupin domain-containing protein [Chitinophagaceae bacterium]|nr:FdtA/QdtA family cupin domain-containing protein [Chitinophagaceae bacterium]